MRYDFNIKRGDTFRRNMLFQTATGNQVDITASEFILYVIEKSKSRVTPLITYRSSEQLQLKIAGTNNLYFELTDEETLSYSHKDLHYQLMQNNPDGSSYARLEGEFNVK